MNEVTIIIGANRVKAVVLNSVTIKQIREFSIRRNADNNCYELCLCITVDDVSMINDK